MQSRVVAKDLFFELSPGDGTITAVSPALVELLGYEREELLGVSHGVIVDSEFSKSPEYQECWTVVKGGGHKFARVKLVGKDKKKQIWVHCCFSPVLDFLGEVAAVRACCLDVTSELLHIVEADAQINAIERTQAVAVFGIDGTIFEVNPVFLELLAYSSSEVLGKHHNMFVEQPFATGRGYAEFWERLGNGIVQTGEFKHIGRGGREVWLLASYIPITDLSGMRNKVVMQAMDIRQQKATDYAKTLLLANISHEIRTPMNGIFGMLALLKDKLVDQVSIGYLDTCMRSTESLMSVLDGVLLFAKAEANAIVLEHVPFNLNQLIEDVLQVASTGIGPDHDIELTYFVKSDVPLCLIGDSSLLRHVLLNLVSNGVKFTRLGEVSLDVSVHSRDPLVLQFEVVDTGIGISDADQEKLFLPFSQVDGSATRKFGGSGLGLATCKRIVGLFGGELRVRSRFGRGSTFSFTASFALDGRDQSLVRALDITAEEVALLARLKVLIVDANATTCLLLEETLRAFKCDVAYARTVREGIEALRVASIKGAPVSVVLTSFNIMKGMDRLGVHPIVIGLDKMLAPEASLKGCVGKPIHRGTLLQMMCSLVSVGEDKGDAKRKHSAPVTAATPVTVLAVEDNDVNRQILCSFLRQNNFKVVEAIHGADALDRLEENNVDLVLMDIHMPVLDGVSTMRIMRERGYSVPVVVITADVTDENRIRCEKEGAAKVAFKPIGMKQLVEVMGTVLGRRFQQQQVGAVVESMALFDDSFLEDLEANVKNSVVKDWKESLVVAMSDMSRHCEAGDWENLRKVAHSAKGAAAQIGACKVSRITREIESEAKVDILKQHRIRALLERLGTVMGETFKYLNIE